MSELPQSSARWLAEHVLPHEPLLRSWLKGRFGAQIEVDDVVQEAFTRLLRAHEEGTVVSPKAFAFQTARNLALKQIRHRSYTHPPGWAEIPMEAIPDSSDSIPDAVTHAEDVQLLVQAIQALPERCRQIFTLRKIYGLSQKEIAEQLGISENTVEVQGSLGIRKCAEYFRRHGDNTNRA